MKVCYQVYHVIKISTKIVDIYRSFFSKRHNLIRINEIVFRMDFIAERL